jgi:hypothetical protein
MAKIVNPALFIGLGGTGHKVLLQVKKAMLKNYGEVPPMVKLLCMDTDRRELLSSLEEISYAKKKKDGSTELTTESIKFEPNETVGIPITNPQGLANENFVRSWVDDSVFAQIGPSDTGAKQIRQMGRFAIFENFMKQNIAGQIENRINELKNIIQLRNTDYSLGDSQAKPCIHLVFSPCGGTGAGTFIDILTIIKNIDPQIEVFGYLVMPDFYTRFPMTMSVIQNAYASLMEIDHLMGQDASKKEMNKWWSNHPKVPFEVDYSGNGTKIKLPGGSKGFFEYLYLFDNINEKGKFIESVDDMYDRIGRILYLMVSGPGTKMQSAYSNNKDYLYPSSEKTFYKRRNYSSMGISQIILDRHFLRELKKNQIIRTILNAYIYKDSVLEQSTMNTFIDANEWREDSGKDMLIDKLVQRSILKYSTDSLYPNFKKGCHLELKTNIDNFHKQWDERSLSSAKTVREQQLNIFYIKIEEELKKYLKSRGGLSQGKQFLAFLDGSFKGMADEMDNEIKVHKSNREKLYKDVPLHIESIKNEEESFSPFGKEKRIRESCEAFVANAEKILIENWQVARKEAAKLFYDMSIEFLRAYQKQINEADQLMMETSSDLEREYQKIINSSNRDSDFERSIHYYYKELLNGSTDDINLEEAFKTIDFSSLLNLKSVNEIKSDIYNYIATTDAIKNIDNLKIENILKSLDKSVMENLIHYLDVSSSVCIDVDQSFLLTTDKAFMDKFGFICVENDDNSLFVEGGSFYNSLSTEGGYSSLKTFSTGDPDRITMIKVAGMFPGSAIKRIKNYKSKFENSSLYHFSDVYFEKNAMDLIEGADDMEEGLKWFTVGSALGKIYLDKGAMVIEIEGGKKEPLYEGTRNKTNRATAAEIFMKNKRYVNYISEYYNKFYDDNGKPIVKEKIQNFYNSITTVSVLGKIFDNIDRETNEYNNIFEEKRLLREFAMNQFGELIQEAK